MSVEGKYIYCIAWSQGLSERFGPIGIGGRGDEVYVIGFGGIAAVVSDVPMKKLPVTRDNLILHERIIEEVMKTRTVLPARYCTIAGDENEVRKILDKEHATFIELLREMEDKKELGLKAVFREEVIYREILAEYHVIRASKERVEKDARSISARQRLIEIGRMVENALEKEKAKYREYIMSSIAPLALRFKVNASCGERMIINAAFLVENAKEALVDRKVNELDSEYGDKIKFKYVGTPPFNFVSINITTEGIAACF